MQTETDVTYYSVGQARAVLLGADPGTPTGVREEMGNKERTI